MGKRQLVFFMSVFFIFFSSCGGEEETEYVDSDPGAGTNSTYRPVGTSTSDQRQLLKVPIKLSQADNTGLNLADATAFSISLDTCATGHTATVTQTVAYLEVYEFDRNCLAKLTTFTLNGLVYTPKSGSGFDTWQAGDLATFEVSGASPADELQVEVISTLANPVVAGGSIHYEFSEITAGSDETLLEAVVRESASLAIDGQAAPNFSIKQVALVGTDANGNGEFRIQLECNQTVTGTGNDITCYDVRLDSIYMAIAVDSYGSAPTKTNLEAIFTAMGGGKQIDMSAEAFTAGGGSPALTNGGFITADTGDADVIVIPVAAPMHANPNMIFALKSGPSYLYFNVDVTTITQNGDN